MDTEADMARAQREAASLRRRVESLLEHPSSAGAAPQGRWRRHPDYCLVENPSFNEWTSWSTTRDFVLTQIWLRRIVWHQGKDCAELADPMRRLKHIGTECEPTVELTDRVLALKHLPTSLTQFEGLRLALPVPDDRLTIDGTQYEVIIRSGGWKLRASWTSLPEALDPLGVWWGKSRKDLQGLLDVGPPG